MAKSKYASHVLPHLETIKGWARDGATDEEIYKRLGISKETFYTYKREYIAFFDALKDGKEIADYKVENSLYKRAMGYSYDEITQELSDGVITVKKIVTKEIVPDVTAQIFWLKNRRPKQWRDRVEEPRDDEKGKLDKLVEALKEAAKA